MQSLDRRILPGAGRPKVREPRPGFVVKYDTPLSHGGGDSSNAHRPLCAAAPRFLTESPESLRELVDDAGGEHVRHVQCVPVDLVVGGHVYGPVALKARNRLPSRQPQVLADIARIDLSFQFGFALLRNRAI